ncbi:hypothetical protein QLF84_24770, partial [Salmonella enterica subsp. enterica serovar Oslo]|uniref:hypothetical protein n=1 Tax=Salmonella enterica TaxID=28901 RepID=UPI00288F4309
MAITKPFYVNDVDECARLPRGNGNFAHFLLFLPRICMINQRLHIVYVRLATNLLSVSYTHLTLPTN